MKTFLKNLWLGIVAVVKFLWTKLVTFINKFNWNLKLVFKGIEGDNTKYDKIWLIVPSLYGRRINKEIEIGLMWLGVGLKMVVSRKEILPPV